VACQTARVNRFGDARMRLVYAPGRGDGTFTALRTIAEDAAEHVSAANRSGEALVAFRDRRGHAYVAERRVRRGFGRPRPLRPGGSGAAAINDAGRRVVAWWDRDGVHARARDRGGRWSPPIRVAHTRPFYDAKLRATVTPRGQIVVVWHTADVGEDRPFDIVAGVAVRSTRSVWRSHELERSRPTGGPYLAGTPAIPLVDSAGHVHVTWTGITRGAPVVKLARITPGGVRDRTVLSGPVTGAAVDDAAAGPEGSLAVSWSAMPDYRTAVTYVSLRRGDKPFAAPARLTPEGVTGLTGSHIAFQPVTGEAVVALRYVTPGGTGSIQALAG
jgi:hypothetical protein